MATYSLQVKNDSPMPGYVCVYTTSPDTQQVQQNLRSMAWFSKSLNPNSLATFTWNLDFSFAWAETGDLVPGVHFAAGQIIQADPSSANNKAYFDVQNEAYTFGDPSKAVNPSPGALIIATSGKIPHARASIGIGINGKAALAVNATPNYNFTFIPKIKYWAVFGTFKEGVVLDLNSMVNRACEISFPPNQYAVKVALQGDNTWSAVTSA
jgi:hypothetical protein